MKVNKRLIEIFQLLISDNKNSIKNICDSLNLSERSVRYEIDNINYILNFNGLDQIKKLEKGSLELKVNDKVLKIFSSFIDITKLSKEDRLDYIYMTMLIDGKLNIARATKELEISRTTVKTDLKEVESELNKENIVLKENKITGSEQKIRNFILKKYCMRIGELYYSTTFNEYDKCSVEYHISKILNEDKISNIKSYVTLLCKKFNNNSHEFYEVIFSYLIIAYIRIQKGDSITEVENKEFLIRTNEYEIIRDTINILEDNIKIYFKEDELIVLTDYLLGLTSYTYNTTIFQDWVQTKIVVKQIVNYVNSRINTIIKYDDVLLSGLLNHIKPMIYRAKNGLSIEKELYYKSLEGNFELYKIVKEALTLLEELMKIKLNDGEVALFTIHFLAAIRRNEESVSTLKKVLLVCAGGYGTSGIIKGILEENYNVKIIDSISYYQLLEYDTSNIEIVVSTIKINKDISEKIDKPVVLVTPFFTFEDEDILDKFSISRKKGNEYDLDRIMNVIKENTTIINEENLRRQLENLIYKNENITYKIPETLFELLNEDKVEIIEKIDSWEEALRRCGNKLIKTNEIKPEYMDEIFKVIETFGAYFVLANEIAIPHGQFNINVNNPAMSVMYIREGITFPGGMNVKLIILIASSEKNILIKTVEKISEMSKNANLYNDLKCIKDRMELIEYLR